MEPAFYCIVLQLKLHAAEAVIRPDELLRPWQLHQSAQLVPMNNTFIGSHQKYRSKSGAWDGDIIRAIQDARAYIQHGYRASQITIVKTTCNVLARGGTALSEDNFTLYVHYGIPTEMQ